jgi:glycosyltransferase involved in cell wall biosynthesis
MIKIAIISNSAFSVVNFRKRLIEDFSARGWKVYVLAPDFNDKFRNALAASGAATVDIKMARTGINPLADLGSLYSLSSVLKHISPSVTFSYGIKPVIYGLIASKIAGISNRYAMVAGLGTMYVDEVKVTFRRSALKRMVNLMYRFSLRYARKVFFQNDDDIQLFVMKNIVPEEKVIKINGSGVDINEFEMCFTDNDPVIFILISRLIKEKGIYEYIEAAREIKRSNPDTEFILVGDRDLNPGSVDHSELIHWVEEGLIEWPGHVDDVRPWLRRAGVFVLPTYYREGIPKSILEAMAMGKPVITTNVPGCREAVSDGENGFLIKPEDVESLIKVMKHFIRKPEIIKKMGSKSRQLAVEKFNVTEVNKKIIDNIETHSVL